MGEREGAGLPLADRVIAGGLRSPGEAVDGTEGRGDRTGLEELRDTVHDVVGQMDEHGRGLPVKRTVSVTGNAFALRRQAKYAVPRRTERARVGPVGPYRSSDGLERWKSLTSSSARTSSSGSATSSPSSTSVS